MAPSIPSCSDARCTVALMSVIDDGNQTARRALYGDNEAIRTGWTGARFDGFTVGRLWLRANGVQRTTQLAGGLFWIGCARSSKLLGLFLA